MKSNGVGLQDARIKKNNVGQSGSGSRQCLAAVEAAIIIIIAMSNSNNNNSHNNSVTDNDNITMIIF